VTVTAADGACPSATVKVSLAGPFSLTRVEESLSEMTSSGAAGAYGPEGSQRI